MAFYPQSTGFGYSSFPSYGYPTTFAPQQVQGASASQHEGSQAGEEQSHARSVSGFAAQPIDAGFGFPYGAAYGAPYGAPVATGATFIGQQQFAPAAYGQQTFIGQQQFAAPAAYGQQTVFPGAAYSTALVPVAAPAPRRPGYNERLVAWRNRQKAFNRYKRDTKQAIKSANSVQYHNQHTVLAHQHTVLAPAYGSAYGQSTIIGGAAPIYGGAPAYGSAYGQSTIIGGAYPYGANYGATYLPQGYPIQGGFLPTADFGGVAQHEQQEGQYGDFTSYSSAGAAQEVQQEEPEIRGTQV